MAKNSEELPSTSFRSELVYSIGTGAVGGGVGELLLGDGGIVTGSIVGAVALTALNIVVRPVINYIDHGHWDPVDRSH